MQKCPWKVFLEFLRRNIYKEQSFFLLGDGKVTYTTQKFVNSTQTQESPHHH